MNKSAVVHCVRSYGTLYDLVSEKKVVRVSLHGYKGSREMVGMFNKLRGTKVYFGVSARVGRSLKGFAERVRDMPDDRILVESGALGVGVVVGRLDEAVEMVATAKGWSLEDTVRICDKNLVEFLGT